MPPNRQPRSAWISVIKEVQTPLSFFVLILLIIESFLCVVFIKSDLSPEHKWDITLWMIGIFIGDGLAVLGLTIWLPKNLLFRREEHSADQIDPSALKDQIEDLIVANVKDECLKK